jgi:hypothetical protein
MLALDGGDRTESTKKPLDGTFNCQFFGRYPGPSRQYIDCEPGECCCGQSSRWLRPSDV